MFNGGAFTCCKASLGPNRWGGRVSPILLGFLLLGMRAAMAGAMLFDGLFYPRLRSTRIKSSTIIVGNPRTGTTFLQPFLCENQFGAGVQLYRMVYPSLIVQKLITPIVPALGALSPARYHKTVAHPTDLQSIETDDAAVLLHSFDGFFPYGFLLGHTDEDYLPYF